MSDLIATARADMELARVRSLVVIWSKRLGISERIAIETFPPGDPEARCSMKPARMIPEAQGLWDFVLEWSEGVHPDDVEHTVVHELTHLLLEPLRERYLTVTRDDEAPMYIARGVPDEQLMELRPGVVIAMPAGGTLERVVPEGREETWETVVQRVAAAFERSLELDGM